VAGSGKGSLPLMSHSDTSSVERLYPKASVQIKTRERSNQGAERKISPP
jgi:hypothetical protein